MEGCVNGVEILNKVYQISDKSSGMIVMYVMFAIISVVFAGMCIWGVKEMLEDSYPDIMDAVGVCVLILFALGSFVGDFFLIRGIVDEARTRETIVYATIDDTVPWTEINQRYELIRQDGKIYQLRVREDGETP